MGRSRAEDCVCYIVLYVQGSHDPGPAVTCCDCIHFCVSDEGHIRRFSPCLFATQLFFFFLRKADEEDGVSKRSE